MPYAIEYCDEKGKKTFVIENGKIVYYSCADPYMRLRRSSLTGFKLQPGRAFYAPHLPTLKVDERMAAIQKILQRGGTLVVLTCQVTRMSSLDKAFSIVREAMAGSPIDYMIGVSIDLSQISQRLILDCVKRKVPFIQFRFSDWASVFKEPWEWWREASLGSGLLFIPEWQGEMDGKKEKAVKRGYRDWTVLARQLNLPTASPLNQEIPLSAGQMKTLGIYPIKGALTVGSDCDYILYPESLEPTSVNGYDDTAPCIVVVRGHVREMDAGGGRELKVSMPNRFTGYWEC
ncbi:hypothetical protein ACFO4N_03540 [Camelliibacillus cellulosilyticus]|uniref:Amidohydrolase family protein n=1 Tax=Camelliibacillus cellulosilyticus TaxID=2174486 RepID=A0ABV9GI59_9BACL